MILSWEADGSDTYWSITDPRVDNNAILIAEILVEQDYDPKAIAAVLGNIMHEGTMNPWLWERGTPTYDEFMLHQSDFNDRGYGLFQYTNPNKYINSNNTGLPGYDPHFRDVQGSPEDGEAQTYFFFQTITTEWTNSQLGWYHNDFDQELGIDTYDFDITVPDFISANVSGNTDEDIIELLTGAFELCYERPSQQRAVDTYQMRVNDAIYFYSIIKDVSARSRFDFMYYLKPWWKRRIL